MKYALTLFAALLVISSANAQTCGSYRVYRTQAAYSTPYVSYSTPVTYSTPYVAPVVKKVVEYKKEDPYYLKFVAVVPLVELPTYSAYYTPPYSPVAPPPSVAKGMSKEDLKEIVDLIKGLDNRMKALEGRTEGKATPLAPVDPKVDPKTEGKADSKIPDVRLVNQQKCAICHQRGNESKGGRFILSEADGSIVRLNNEQLGELDEQLSTNAMPKINATSKAAKITPLTDEEYAAFRQEISRQRALNKKK